MVQRGTSPSATSRSALQTLRRSSPLRYFENYVALLKSSASDWSATVMHNHIFLIYCSEELQPLISGIINYQVKQGTFNNLWNIG
jgi:hypothetical protein